MKDRTNWFVDLLGGDSHNGHTTTRRRKAQAGQLSGVHHVGVDPEDGQHFTP